MEGTLYNAVNWQVCELCNLLRRHGYNHDRARRLAHRLDHRGVTPEALREVLRMRKAH